jgi:hypothetical protein
MITSADVRQMIASLPEVEERHTWDSATFRVSGKIFAMLHPSEQRLTVKASPAEQAALLAVDPNTFSPAPYTGRFGWVRFNLASVTTEQLYELLVEAWRQTAPKRLVADFDRQASTS